MKYPLTPSETALSILVGLALAAACLGPPVDQYANYHAFADQRARWGLPFAMDVLSNLPFAVMGLWGLVRLHAVRPSSAHSEGCAVKPHGAQRHLARLFFTGLLVTAACSTWYHLQPQDSGLAVDRLGMVMAFAGLTGLAVADRVSVRSGIGMALAVLVLGPVSVGVWATSANLLPWSILQGGGMLLVLAMAARRPIAGAWGVPLVAIIALYALAKMLELGDQPVFAMTHGVVSGHTLKHVAAALSAWPLIALMHNGGHVRFGRTTVAHA